MPTSIAAGASGARRWRSLVTSRFFPIWIATVALFVLSGVFVKGALSDATLRTMLPYAGALMIAALGQYLVIQGGGLDLSVPGVIAVSAMMVTRFPEVGGNGLTAAIIAIAVATASGLVSGLIVVYLRFSPLVSTLAVNALLTGLVLKATSGFAYTAPESLTKFGRSRPLGVPLMLLAAIIVVVVLTLGMRQTSVGRRLVAVGVNERAARAIGISTHRYVIGSYAAAATCYGLVGVLLAGLLKIPGPYVGTPYLILTFAAVVMGGSPLLGGEGSVVATAIGALFLTQLNQVVLNMGGTTATQYLVQGSVITLSLIGAGVTWRAIFKPRRHRAEGSLPDESQDEPTDDRTFAPSGGGVA